MAYLLQLHEATVVPYLFDLDLSREVISDAAAQYGVLRVVYAEDEKGPT